MKKLLLVLMVVALAAFLLVGCIPTTPADGDGEGVGNGGGIALPAITIADSVGVGTKAYVKAGSHEVTITFAEAVPVADNVSAWIGPLMKTLPTTIPEGAKQIPLYTTDNIVFKGKTSFSGPCTEDYIYVSYGDPCCPQVAKAPFVVDGGKPYACMLVELLDTCTADVPFWEKEWKFVFDSDFGPLCPPFVPDWLWCPEDTNCFCTDGCCGDGCSGLKSWQIDIYDRNPYNECCEIICPVPVSTSGEMTGCPIGWTSDCLITTLADDDDWTGKDYDKRYFVIVTLKDYVGNTTKYYATLQMFPHICDFPYVCEYRPCLPIDTMCGDGLGCPDWCDEFMDDCDSCCALDWCFEHGPMIGWCGATPVCTK